MKSCILSNGMKVVISSVKIQEIISVGMFFHVGSQNETENTNGITHLIEHMISDWFLDYCSRIGGRSNALTTKEYCCFFSKCSNRQYELLLECFRQVCVDIYSEDDILRAKKVVFNEMQNIDAEQDLDQQVFQTHFKGDPLRFLPIGKRSAVKGLLANDIHAFFKKHIQPQNCVLSIVGCIDEDEGINTVERIFSDWYGTFTPAKQEPLIQVPRKKDHKILLSDSKTSSLRILFDGTSRTSDDKVVCSLLCSFLGGGIHSKLFKQIREKWAMAYNIFCAPQFFSRRGIVFLKAMGTSVEKTVIIEKISNLMLDLANGGISSMDIERCKKSLIEDHIFKHETLSSKMTLLGQQLLLEGCLFTDNDIINAINQVKLEQVQSELNRILSGNITILSDSISSNDRLFFNHIFT